MCHMVKSNQIPPSHQLAQEDARCQIATYGKMCIHFFVVAALHAIFFGALLQITQTIK